MPKEEPKELEDDGFLTVLAVIGYQPLIMAAGAFAASVIAPDSLTAFFTGAVAGGVATFPLLKAGGWAISKACGAHKPHP